MTFQEKAILATIIYYDILDYPLTILEIARLLINSQRFTSGFNGGVFENSRIAEAAAALVRNGVLEEANGFYFLPGRKNLCWERVEKNKIAEEKWEKACRYLFWAQGVPYLEAVFASGSLALNHTGKDSDLDVLVVTRPGRIWLSRLFLSLAMSFLGARRRGKDKVAPDKICLNHYITSASLHIPFHSLYNAQTYFHLVPVFYRSKFIVENFWHANNWVLDFVGHWRGPIFCPEKEVRKNMFLIVFAGFVEKFLDTTGLGFVLEKIARKIQLPRINTNLPGRITVNDQQLEFHPFSIEEEILKEYNQKISATGVFGGYQEFDSGLKKA